jgi:single-strand DNA-binding protein
MANLNRVLLIGNVTRDPELRYTPKGTPVTEIGVAINRVYTTNDEKHEDVTFVQVELWARLAEVAAQYLKKGRSVFIEGRLQVQSWDDKQSGQKRSRILVIGEHLQMLGKRPEGSETGIPKPLFGTTSQDPELDVAPEDISF